MTKEDIQKVLVLALEYYKSEVFGTDKESEKPSRERIDWIYDKMKGSSEISNDLEEAAEEYLQKVKAGFLRTLEHPTAKDCFKDGAKWQKEHDAVLIEIAYNDGITIGMTKQKEQMMKEAVEGEVMDFCFVREVNYSSAKIEFSTIPELKVGNKVRVIVLPKENEK